MLSLFYFYPLPLQVHPDHHAPVEESPRPPSSGDMDSGSGMQILSKEDDRQVSVFAQPGILAGKMSSLALLFILYKKFNGGLCIF